MTIHRFGRCACNIALRKTAVANNYQTHKMAGWILKIAEVRGFRARNRHLRFVVLTTSVFRIPPWPPSKLEHPDRHPSKERRNPGKPVSLLQNCPAGHKRAPPPAGP